MVNQDHLKAKLRVPLLLCCRHLAQRRRAHHRRRLFDHCIPISEHEIGPSTEKIHEPNAQGACSRHLRQLRLRNGWIWRSVECIPQLLRGLQREEGWMAVFPAHEHFKMCLQRYSSQQQVHLHFWRLRWLEPTGCNWTLLHFRRRLAVAQDQAKVPAV